ncbi:MAG: hypothetical protein PHI73_00970 [Patescibacteria group bacterium]|nr:hypothetical protein [Patescibacteria group bacterium]
MADQPTKKFNLWLGKIETKEQALKVIKNVSLGFYFVAGLQILLGIIIGSWEIVVDGAIFAVFSFLFSKFKNRTLAIILLVLSCLALLSTGYNIVSSGLGGTNIILAIIMVWASIRAMQATAVLSKSNLLTQNPPPPPSTPIK